MADTKSTRTIQPVRMRKLPQVQAARLGDVRATQAFDQVREILAARFGDGGAHTEKAVTWGDLVNAGLASLRGTDGQLGVVGSPTGPVLPIPPLPGEDRTPPAPTGLDAVAGLSMVILTWSAPVGDYIAYAEIHRAETQNLSDAVAVGQTSGWVYSDYADGGKTFWYWVRWVSHGGRVGPFSLPTSAQLVPNPDWMLEQLAGQVTESALTKSLQARITLLDGPASLAGSVAARVLAEATARGVAIQTEQQARRDGDLAVAQTVTSLASTVTRNNEQQTAALQIEARTRAGIDDGLLAQYTVKVDVNGRVAGFGLASTARNGVPSSEFVVVADRFAVVSPAATGQTPKVPFVIGTVDGVTGTVIADAFIADAAISRAKIGLAAIDDARVASLSAAKITFGEMSGDRIAAYSLTANRITTASLAAAVANIGTAVIGSAHIRDGVITSAQIADGTITRAKLGAAVIGSAQIADGAINSAKIAYGSIGTAHIMKASIGGAEIADAVITAANIADAQITRSKIRDAAVDTLQIAGNAVTVPASTTALGTVSSGTIVALASTTGGASAVALFTGTAMGSQNGGTCELVMRIDGREIGRQEVQVGQRWVSGGGDSGGYNAAGQQSITFVRQITGVGGGYFTVTVDIASNSGLSFRNSVLFVLGTKR